MHLNLLVTGYFLFLLSAHCEPHIMYKLGFVIVISCAFFPWGSGAPKPLAENPGSQLETSAEQNDRLQEEIEGRQNILSKVG